MQDVDELIFAMIMFSFCHIFLDTPLNILMVDERPTYLSRMKRPLTGATDMSPIKRDFGQTDLLLMQGED